MIEGKKEELTNKIAKALELVGEDLESKFAELEGGDDIEKELETLRSQLKSGVEAIALPPSDLDVNEVKTVEIQEVEVELEEMRKSMDNS